MISLKKALLVFVITLGIGLFFVSSPVKALEYYGFYGPDISFTPSSFSNFYYFYSDGSHFTTLPTWTSKIKQENKKIAITLFGGFQERYFTDVQYRREHLQKSKDYITSNGLMDNLEFIAVGEEWFSLLFNSRESWRYDNWTLFNGIETNEEKWLILKQKLEEAIVDVKLYFPGKKTYIVEGFYRDWIAHPPSNLDILAVDYYYGGPAECTTAWKDNDRNGGFGLGASLRQMKTYNKEIWIVGQSFRTVNDDTKYMYLNDCQLQQYMDYALDPQYQVKGLLWYLWVCGPDWCGAAGSPSNKAKLQQMGQDFLATLNQQAPVINSFSASPTSINTGQSSTLSWSVTGATSLSISGIGTVTGTSRTVTPTTTTTYTLTATSATGQSSTRQVTVTVNSVVSPVISSFTSSSLFVAPGESTTLSWATSNATSLSISGIGTVTGTSRTVTPTTTTTYTLTATGSSGATATKTVTVTVIAPQIASFTASAATITPGQSTTLSWTVYAATSYEISGIGVVTGTSRVVSPSQTTTYYLTAYNSIGTSTKAVTVTVSALPAPTISSFTASPESISPGQSTTLSWTVSNASTISISGIGTVTGTSRVVSPSTTTTYVLTATNSSGVSATQQLTVSLVSVPAPVITSFSASPQVISPGESSTLSWSVTGATSLNISTIGTVTGTSTTVSPTVTTTYTLTALNSAGASVSKTATVTIMAPQIASFTASPSSITAGQSSVLSWSVFGATKYEITGIGVVTGTSRTVSPTTTTTFTLTATNSVGQASTKQVTVNVASVPVINSFVATPGSVTFGQASTLSWSVSNASTISISGIGTVTGTSRAVSPSTTTSYTLTATNTAGVSVTKSVTVNVVPAPTISSFTASPTSVTTGQSSTLSWSVTGATSLSISGIGTVTGTSRSVSPTTTTTYTLTASNSIGATTTKTVTITVSSVPAPVISSFVASPDTVTAGQTTTLSWGTSNTTSLSISGIGTVTGTSRSVSPTTTTTYILTATNSAGASVTKSVTVVVVAKPEIPLVTLPQGTTNQVYVTNVYAQGGSGSYNWSVTEGLLPQGLSLQEVSCVSSAGSCQLPAVIRGTPTTEGEFPFTLTLTSGGVSVSRQFNIKVTKATVVPDKLEMVTTSPLRIGTVGQSYSLPIGARGGSGSYAWSLTQGSLPAGLTLGKVLCDSVSEVCQVPVEIHGTPQVAGINRFTIQVTSGSESVSREFVLEIKGVVTEKRVTINVTSVSRLGITVNVVYENFFNCGNRFDFEYGNKTATTQEDICPTTATAVARQEKSINHEYEIAGDYFVQVLINGVQSNRVPVRIESIDEPPVVVFRDGSLLLDKGTIYVIENGKKRPIASMEIFRQLGYKLNRVVVGSTENIIQAEPILSPVQRHPRGSLIIDKGTVYFVGAEVRYPFPSKEVFFSWDNKFEDILPANTSDLLIPVGPIAQMR